MVTAASPARPAQAFSNSRSAAILTGNSRPRAMIGIGGGAYSASRSTARPAASRSNHRVKTSSVTPTAAAILSADMPACPYSAMTSSSFRTRFPDHFQPLDLVRCRSRKCRSHAFCHAARRWLISRAKPDSSAWLCSVRNLKRGRWFPSHHTPALERLIAARPASAESSASFVSSWAVDTSAMIAAAKSTWFTYLGATIKESSAARAASIVVIRVWACC